MLIFLDTADIKEIREMADLGVLDGVTTNPSLMAKMGRTDYRNVTQEVFLQESSSASYLLRRGERTYPRIPSGKRPYDVQALRP